MQFDSGAYENAFLRKISFLHFIYLILLGYIDYGMNHTDLSSVLHENIPLLCLCMSLIPFFLELSIFYRAYLFGNVGHIQ